MTITRPFLCVVAFVATLTTALTPAANAQAVPDLTKGGNPTGPSPKAKDTLVSNLGPTGLLGWIYQEHHDTSKSRQILVSKVMPGSPADGTLKEGDVILGASGSSTKPEPFSADARKSFGLAIAEAEAKNPATLALQVRREGKTPIRECFLLATEGIVAEDNKRSGEIGL